MCLKAADKIDITMDGKCVKMIYPVFNVCMNMLFLCNADQTKINTNLYIMEISLRSSLRIVGDTKQLASLHSVAVTAALSEPISAAFFVLLAEIAVKVFT